MKSYGPEDLAALLPFPRKDINKYSRGKLTLLVGSSTYPGAASLAALASQRAGAGYTEVYTEASIVRLIQTYHPSLVVRSWSVWDTQFVAASAPDRPCAYLVGSGFDATENYTSQLTRRLLRYAAAPVLIDGGALQILSAKKIRDLSATRFDKGYVTVITPHMGEAHRMGAIFGLNTTEPDELSLQLAQAYGVICVLKGPDTFISDGEEILAMREGTPALAKAGTGDVLAGIIGAFLAQGMEAIDACVLGTTLHARAGACAAAELTDISLCAEDVILSIPAAIKSLIYEANVEED
ncbi:MAG: NAD(P)H-hydrate dehydratase [Raoultibacter sp.]